jgi:4'-phosphopantetheinyl transferase
MAAIVPRLGDRECQVWWVRPDAAAPSLLDLIDEAERARWSRFMREEDKARYLVSHAMLRLLLAAHSGIPPHELRFSTVCRYCGASHGKPELAGSGHRLQFSLSHSGQQAVVAVCRGVPLGVDVEEMKPGRDRVSLIPSVLSEAERRAVEALPRDRQNLAFLRYWTRKEAVLKATGHGLAIPLKSLTLSAHDAAPELVSWTAEPPLEDPVHFVDLAAVAPDHFAALAMLGERLDVVERDAGALLAAG